MIKKKILGIFCHPDDEVLFGWPIFQSEEYKKYLIILCDDSTRNRQNRLPALKGVCKSENINLVECLSEDNNFYALPTRRAVNLLTNSVDRINRTISKFVDVIKPDYIFTHNPVGEYGHGSHRLCFELVSQHPLVKNILFTDICQKSNHRSSDRIPLSVINAYYRERFAISSYFENKLDINFYNRCKAIYDKYNAWTWNHEPVTNCNLYFLENK
jgi:LmbE family N-acetylglucosaminyl deacetylase